MNVLAADKLMMQPKLYSTFLLWLLSELYSTLPEVGDLDMPKLVFFFDEAHTLFEDTSKAGKVTRNGASSVEDVNLSFKHILAKLNISIAKDAIFDNVKVLIRDVKVTGLDDTGKYFEATSNNNSAWSSSLKDANYQLSWEKADGYELPKSVTEGNKQVAQYKYFIESLIMPQSIEEETEKLTIDYTIVSGSNRENYNYVLSLNDSLGNKVFDNFMESNNYTLKLTIKPNVITFDASTDAWTDQTASQNSATAMQP